MGAEVSDQPQVGGTEQDYTSACPIHKPELTHNPRAEVHHDAQQANTPFPAKLESPPTAANISRQPTIVILPWCDLVMTRFRAVLLARLEWSGED